MANPRVELQVNPSAALGCNEQSIRTSLAQGLSRGPAGSCQIKGSVLVGPSSSRRSAGVPITTSSSSISTRNSPGV